MTLSRTIATLGFASTLVLAAAHGATAHGVGAGRAPQGDPSATGCPYGMMGGHMMGGHMMGGHMMGGHMMGQDMMGHGMGRGYGAGPMGPGMMGPGMMGPGMMGPGMMGPGMMGPGMMGPGMMGPGMMGDDMAPGAMGSGPMGRGAGPGMMRALPEDLTPDEVRHMFRHRIEMHGNPNIKVGEVAEVDEDTITVDIVTQDGSLVRRFEVDRHTGWSQPAQ